MSGVARHDLAGVIRGLGEGEPLRIVVPCDVHALSKNQRLHWRERARRVERAKLAARLAWMAAGSPVGAGPVEVALLIRRGRVLDPGNALSGWYACEDALFNRARNGYGITPNDSARWVTTLPPTFETGAAWARRPEVVVTVRPWLGLAKRCIRP